MTGAVWVLLYWITTIGGNPATIATGVAEFKSQVQCEEALKRAQEAAGKWKAVNGICVEK